MGAFVISPPPRLAERSIHRSGPFPPGAFCCTPLDSTTTRSATLMPRPTLPTLGHSEPLFGDLSSPDTEGFSRFHMFQEHVETGEALGVRRRKIAEEGFTMTKSGKCGPRHQGGGSGRSTVEGRAAKRARREGPGPVDTPFGKARQGGDDKGTHQSAGAAAAGLWKGEV